MMTAVRLAEIRDGLYAGKDGCFYAAATRDLLTDIERVRDGIADALDRGWLSEGQAAVIMGGCLLDVRELHQENPR